MRTEENRLKWLNTRIRLIGFILFIIFILAAGGCGGASKSSGAGYSTNSSAQEAPYTLYPESVAMDTAEFDSGGEWYFRDEEAGRAQVQTSKIIKSGNIDMETDRFDQVVQAIKSAVTSNGGYIESGNQRSEEIRGGVSRHYWATLRVPAEEFDTTKAYIEGLAKVSYSSENMENVTAAYYDTQSRLRTRQTEEQRVLEMIDAATRINDLIELEQRLGEIRTDIELYQTQLNNIDSLTRYSTIYVNISEVTSEEMLMVSDNLGQRISNSFTKSVNATIRVLQEIVIFLVGAFVPVCIIGFLVIIGYVTIKRVNRRDKE